MSKPRDSVIQKILINYLEYALAFTTIIECNSVFHYSENYRNTSLEAVLAVLAICIAVFLLGIHLAVRKEAFIADLRKNALIPLALVSVIFLFFVTNVVRIGGNNAVRKYILSFVLFFSVSYYLFRVYRLAGRSNELFFKYADLVFVFAVCNLAVYMVLTLHPEVVQTQQFRTHWSRMGYSNTLNSYLNLVCTGVVRSREIAGVAIFKNLGFFPEPPMFCIPLNTALFVELFLRPKRERKSYRWIVLILAVFSSQATLGMMIAMIACGVSFLRSIGKKNRIAWLCFVFVIVLFICWGLVVLKLDAGESSSTAIHIDDYTVCLKSFLKNPLFGCGFANEEAIREFMSEARKTTNIGLSNSIGVVFAQGGLLLGVFCVLPFLIGLAQILSKHNKRTALWMLGPFLLFCVTIFTYHLLLILFMAYGYSMLELSNEGEKRRPYVVDEEVPAVEKSVSIKKSLVCGGILLVCFVVVCALFSSSALWRTLHRWLNLHQLYFGESAWKLYFYLLLVLLAVLVLKNTICAIIEKQTGKWVAETVAFIIYTILCAVAYPLLYSWVSTLTSSISFLGDLVETLLLAGLYFGGVAVIWLMAGLFRRKKRLAITVLVVTIFACAGMITGAHMLVRRMNCNVERIKHLLNQATQVTNGAVYANDYPVVIKLYVPEIRYTAARDGGFAVLENASVVTNHSRNLHELLDCGYRVGELSPDYLLYSNDAAVIQTLETEGIVFNSYYPYELPANNGISILQSGTYTLTAVLECQPQSDAQHEPVCRIIVTSHYGTKNVKSQTVFDDEFDNAGRCIKQLEFTADNIEGVECSIVSEMNHTIYNERLTLNETPEYITKRTYDGRRQVIHEAYYELSGEPKVLNTGYAALTNVFDRAGHVIRQSYQDTQGCPVLITNGYAAIEREYDERGRIVKEAYLDCFDKPIVRTDTQYSFFSRTYHGKAGSISGERYYDASGNLTIASSGFAGFDRLFDSEDHVICETYLGADEKPILIPAGYAYFRQEYDDRGHVLWRGYYDTEGKPINTGMGYASIDFEYNGDQLSLMTYKDKQGTTLNFGSAYLHHYLQSLLGRGLTVFISIKDDGTNALTRTLMEDLNALGIQIDLIGKYRNSYYAVISSEGVVEAISEYQALKLSGTVDGLAYTISSAGRNLGNYSSIIINGIEYSQNVRGMNFVVFERGSLIESLAFDTNALEMRVTN